MTEEYVCNLCGKPLCREENSLYKERRILKEWEEVTGITWEIIKFRLDSGWKTDRVFTFPLGR
jgi:hypothetical protein